MARRISAKTVLRSFVCTVSILSTTTYAFWPAFPSNLGASAGTDNNYDYNNNNNGETPQANNPKERFYVQSRKFGGSDESGLCTCAREIGAVDSRSRENEEMVQEVRTQLNSVVGAVTALGESIDALSGGKSAAQKYNIAFSARVGYNRPYLGETEVIVFDELVINNGDVYDPYSGKFTSPVPGLYHFETTILSGYNATIETMLVLNGNEVARVFSGGFNDRGSGTNSVLLNMEPSDEVWVSVFFGNGDYVHGLWSTFSGHLVHGYSV